MRKFEDEINEKGRLIYTNVGDSMWPLIRQDKDILVIEKINRKLKKYDIPLYKRDNGKYILHRIIKVRENDYIICGDNRIFKEDGITDKHIIGILTSIIRNGKEIKINSFKYKLYTHLWCDLFFMRYIVIRSNNLFRKIKRKMI